MGIEEALTPDPNFNRPVKDLVYKDLLLTYTFTQDSHDMVIKTWCVSVSYPQCVFYRNKFQYEEFNVECQMDPNIGKSKQPCLDNEQTADEDTDGDHSEFVECWNETIIRNGPARIFLRLWRARI
jgi:hypothetical protein